MAAEAAGDEAPAVSGPALERKLNFLDLPPESQREIMLHCSQSDLICLALVSKHFHELASSILYRNFHIVFPDDDDLGADSPIDGLAGGLDTLTTSEYNYAQHLKDVFMDTLSAGVRGEHSYQSYLYSASCGKFLNTLLYLTLKRATSLEAFRWNIRVELSRPVYKELHRLQSLKRLHIRMQAGESYYNTPPPLPMSVDQHTIAPSNHWPQPLTVSPGAGLAGFSPILPPIIPISMPSGPPPALVPPSNKSALKNKASKRGLSSKEPSTLSGFKNLKSLSILDIDDLDSIPELKACIRNSSSTLSELQLSFSDGLAMQARGPAPESDPEESDVEDEFQVVPASQNTSYDASGPAKAFRAQEERNIQEAVLGKLFDVEPLLAKKPQISTISDKRGKSPEKHEGKGKEERHPSDDPREEFITSIRGASNKLMSLLNGSRDFTPSQEDILDIIAKAARKYVDSSEAPVTAEASKDKEADAAKAETTEGNRCKETATAKGKLAGEDKPGPSVSNDATSSDPTKEGAGESSSASKRKGNAVEVLPEDIDIEHTETVEDAFEEEDENPPPESEAKTMQEQPASDKSGLSESTTSPKMTPSSSNAGSSLAKETTVNGSSSSQHDHKSLLLESYELQENAAGLFENIQAIRTTGTALDSLQIFNAEKQLFQLSKHVADIRHQAKWGRLIENEHAEAKKLSDPHYMRDYIRGTRGFSLESLSIHLVPVKASVLSRAINLSCLSQLTLLNVGNQSPIWTLLAKENKETPLALRSVFTDNVSTAFLSCMSKLPELHELFMLERSAKQKPESFAPRNSTTMDQIRRLVLKKHMHTLRRLMIKDESKGPNWEVNEKAIILMCTRGVQLEELAISMDIHAVHAFMQYFSSLVSLKAIHILHFKNNDTCVWVMREVLKFIVDNLSHNPDLKLEWIAMENDRVDRVIRPSDDAGTEEPAKKSGSKGKSTAPPVPPSAGLGFGSDAYPEMPLDGLDSESESESEDADSGTRLRFKTVGPLPFYDAWGVKIFEKEIRNGRL